MIDDFLCSSDCQDIRVGKNENIHHKNNDGVNTSTFSTKKLLVYPTNNISAL